MSESCAPCTCPQGHDDTVKLLSTVAVGGRAGSAAPTAQAGGGCCGGARGCGWPPAELIPDRGPARGGGPSYSPIPQIAFLSPNTTLIALRLLPLTPGP